MTAPAATDLITIDIDGKSMQVEKGSMIIQASDKAGIPLPRFCYHRKLAIAANCRQCMVEVEMNGKMSPKPLPACATPVADGMKVLTRSPNALKWQRNVMEFLLINHPLDCPICDQGGECELQDISLGFGRSISRFTERKRVVADENIGPLIATDMTRCIHCTRCVRFLGEIAGTDEFGGMGRGENLEIGTYIGRSIHSELGGNIIDVCPVGALTDKVFQFKARPWELIARLSIGYHDAYGANVWLHTLRGKVLRAVPRDNEAINECWLSDRDRYSHQGLYADDRVTQPMLKRNGQWVQVDWEQALAAATEHTNSVAGELGILVHPSSSCEEGALLVRLAAAFGTKHIDHRLRALDEVAAAPVFEMPVADVGTLNAALIIGSHVRHELPLLNHRLRQAALAGASIYALNPVDFEQTFELAGSVIAPPQSMLDELLVLAKAAFEFDARSDIDAELSQALTAVSATDDARNAIKALHDAEASLVLLGEIAAMHPQAAWLRVAARFVAQVTGSACNEIPLGANAIGLDRVGVRPGNAGLGAHAMQLTPRPGYLLYGAEPPLDFADGALIMQALRDAGHVVACTAFASAALKEVADVILPIAAMPEAPTTLVNVDGMAQACAAAVNPPGEARAGWKVLRAWGGMLNADGFGFTEIEQLRAEIEPDLQQTLTSESRKLPSRPGLPSNGLARLATLPIYRIDAVLRRAPALAAHPLSRPAAVALNPDDASALKLADGQNVRVTGGQILPLRIEPRLPAGAVWIEAAHDTTAELLPMGASISVEVA